MKKKIFRFLNQIRVIWIKFRTKDLKLRQIFQENCRILAILQKKDLKLVIKIIYKIKKYNKLNKLASLDPLRLSKGFKIAK